jgi:hypothetical protein
MKTKIGLLIFLSLLTLSCSKEVKEETSNESVTNKTQAVSKSGIGGGRNFIFNDVGFFPIGFYAEGFDTEQGNIYAATTLADAGFDFLFTEHNVMNNDAFTRFFDKCKEVDIKNIIGHYNEINVDFTNRFKSQPNLFMWGIADDGDLSWRQPYSGTPEIIQARTDQMKALDPDHLTMGAITTAPYAPGEATRLKNLIGAIEVQAVQWYPVQLPDARDIRGTYDLMYRTDTIAQKFSRPSMGILQAERFPRNPGIIWPTTTELKFMAYTSLAAGIKGLAFYTFKDYDTNSTIDLTQPALYKAVKDFNQEVKQYLEPVLLGGQFARMTNFQGVKTPENGSDYAIVASHWNYNNSTYFIITNQNNYDSEYVNVKIPDNTRVVMKSLIPSIPKKLNIVGDRIQGSLGPLEVQVLLLQSEQTSLGRNF